MANYTPQTLNSTNYGPEQDTSSVYDSSTDDYDGTDLSDTASDLTYNGILFIEGGSTNYTKQTVNSTNYTPA